MLVIVGGHSRNIGKTSVVCGIIRGIPEARWSAVKVTQYGHGVCSAAGEPCDCTVEYEHPYALSEETEPNRSDSGRFLAAGAEHAWWLRTPMGQLGHALPELRGIVTSSENAILESNSALQFFQPDLYLVVLDYAITDLKDTSRRYFDRANAFVVVDRGGAQPPWRIPARWLQGKPQFRVEPPDFVTSELIHFVKSHL